jgi:predicted chitinase
MNTIYYKHLLSIACTLITGMVIAQSANNSTMPFKEIHQKQFTDNFTAREIKKKELEIAPSQIVFLNITGNQPTKEEKKYMKKKKMNR